MSSPVTPKRRSKRGRTEEASSPKSDASSKPATPRRSARKGKAPETVDDASSPPAQRRRVDNSPGGDLAPLPSSPAGPGAESSLFSSPPQSRLGAPTSEIDLSSPLNYGTPRTPGMGETPIRHRPDIHSDKKMRTVTIGGSDPSEATHVTSELQSEANAGPQLVIWGTDVVVSHCKDKFRRFIMKYTDKNVAEDEAFEGMDITQPYYLQRLEEINAIGEPFLNINCEHLRDFDGDLYRQLINYPQEVIPTFDMAVNDMFFDKYPAAVLEHQIQVRPYNAEKTRNMRSLNPEDIDQLITISGMVIRLSPLIPEMREAFFQCYVCHNSRSVEIERGRITEPVLCTNCNTNHSFALVHNRSQFSDKQMIKLQESPEDMPPGQTPHTVVLYAHSDLVDKVQPGDRVTITGIYRAVPLRVNPRMRNVKSVYKTHIDVVHFRKMDVKRLHEAENDDDESKAKMPQEKIDLIKKLSTESDIYERLARAIAPSIYENDDIKKGILLQLFGGTRKDFTNAGRGKFRSEMNILLCGDPGTSKSQLLQYVYNLIPRGQYTSGKGSSAVGLTAYITKDPDTRQLVLQTGALVLSDNGICCIDEFDKMNDSTRSVLHEVMEQQTLSIAKAGIICSLNARTSILAAANPVESQWNKNRTITENIQLPHTLLSRFDLIFLILDPQDELYDRRLASHLVSLYFHGKEKQEEEFLDMNILRDYISYAKSSVHPKISEDAGQAFIQEYVNMRKIGSGRGQVSAYPRQLESLIRLAEAHSKMRLCETVEVSDVEEAMRLYKEALKQAAVDPTTGKIDISILTTGISGAARKRKAEVTQALKKLIQEKGKVPTLKQQKLFEELRERSDLPVPKDMFEEALKELQDEDFLIVTNKDEPSCDITGSREASSMFLSTGQEYIVKDMKTFNIAIAQGQMQIMKRNILEQTNADYKITEVLPTEENMAKSVDVMYHQCRTRNDVNMNSGKNSNESNHRGLVDNETQSNANVSVIVKIENNSQEDIEGTPGCFWNSASQADGCLEEDPDKVSLESNNTTQCILTPGEEYIIQDMEAFQIAKAKGQECGHQTLNCLAKPDIVETNTNPLRGSESNQICVQESSETSEVSLPPNTEYIGQDFNVFKIEKADGNIQGVHENFGDQEKPSMKSVKDIMRDKILSKTKQISVNQKISEKDKEHPTLTSLLLKEVYMSSLPLSKLTEDTRVKTPVNCQPIVTQPWSGITSGHQQSPIKTLHSSAHSVNKSPSKTLPLDSSVMGKSPDNFAE